MTAPADTKPEYRVPTMREISRMKPNGLVAASTFSGCGGSSLGYRMAGYDVRFASEFVPIAADTYEANCRKGTTVDRGDVRQLTGDRILEACRVERGQLDLLDGSPPCASFSTAGKRSEGWGQQRKYSDTAQRVDDLFYEFARLVEEVQPRTFVAENVSGLVKGVAKGYFLAILAKLRSCGYRVEAKLLDAQWLGVPQARQRLIFVGVREDLGLDPAFPKPLPYRYTLQETILPPDKRDGSMRVVHDTAGLFSLGDVTGSPSPTITANAASPWQYQVWDIEPHHGPDGRISDPETGARIDLNDTAMGRDLKRLESMGKVRRGQRSPSGRRFFSMAVADQGAPSPTVTASAGPRGVAGVVFQARKYTLGELRAVCGFPPDFQLLGTYVQRWERLGRAVPPVMMSHVAATLRDEVLS